MLLQPNAKINIGLYIVRKRPDGYHDLETIFYPIPLRDNLDINAQPDNQMKSEFRQRGIALPDDVQSNLIYKVYTLLKSEFPELPPVDVELYKRIPTGAGLGGGSSDAAFMMKGLNDLFDLQLTEEDMEQRVATLGADCAFFVRNKPVFATGIGNVFEPIPLSLKGWHLALVKPPLSVPTREAYAFVTPQPAKHDLRKVLLRPVDEWKALVGNDFENSVFEQYPSIKAIKQTLYDMGATYAAMSGSGSSVFGLFRRPVTSLHEVFSDCFVFETELVV